MHVDPMPYSNNMENRALTQSSASVKHSSDGSALLVAHARRLHTVHACVFDQPCYHVWRMAMEQI